MRIAVAQTNPTIGALKANTDEILVAITRAKKEGADIILFPETAICGYPPEDLLLLPHFIEAIRKELGRIVEASDGIAVVVGTVRENPKAGQKPLLNSAAVIQDGNLLGFQDKTLLADYDVFFERRYFAPNETFRLWNLWGAKVGITICEDMWSREVPEYSRDPIEEIRALQPEIVLNLSASPYYLGRLAIRKQLGGQVAKRLGVPFVYCNEVGGQDSLIFDGRSFVMNGQGEILHLAQGFVEDFFIYDDTEPHPVVSLPDSPMQSLYEALSLGVHDYFHKQGFEKGAIGLSGGIDSAVTACIAVEALGRENVLAITMPSRYTSEETLADAKKLADNLGIKLHTIPIEKPFESYLEILGPYFEGKEHDVTEENLQARIRGMLMMAFSNKFATILLSCGNKSELAMGYATLYGDLCGGLGVLSDVTKESVYALARWINRSKEIIPEAIIDRPPSAELRYDQKDSDTLPDYAVVDAVLVDYVEEHLSIDEIVAKRGFDRPLVADLVRRIHRNEYKRRQAPIGLRVTRKAFTVGRRFPIVQGWE